MRQATFSCTGVGQVWQRHCVNAIAQQAYEAVIGESNRQEEAQQRLDGLILDGFGGRNKDFNAN